MTGWFCSEPVSNKIPQELHPYAGIISDFQTLFAIKRMKSKFSKGLPKWFYKQVKAFNPAINYIFLADFMAEKSDTIVHVQNPFEEIYKRKYVE